MAESTHSVSTPTPQAVSPSTDASTMRVTLPAEKFALAGLFERVPDVRVECESTVASSDGHTLLAVRTDERQRAIDAALQSASGVAAADCFGERADGWTYRVSWKGRPRQLIQQLVGANVTLLAMWGRGGEWNLQLLAPDREGIAQAHGIMEDIGCGAECRSISSFDGEGGGSSRSNLTDEQQTALVEAFEAGYYNVPRDTTMKELADALGISHQALSERFRRAYQQLIKTEFALNEKE